MAPRGISRFGVEFMVVCLYLSIDFWASTGPNPRSCGSKRWAPSYAGETLL